MYISELEIENFRIFGDRIKVLLNNGFNIFIGQNNSGKTTLIKAIELLFDENSKRKLTIGDFHKNISVNEIINEPPKITLSAKLIESNDEEEYSDDLITVSTWLTRIDKPYEARITYEYYLPEKYIKEYKDIMGKLNSSNMEDYWNEIEHRFIPKYKYHMLAGDPKLKTNIDNESLKKFDFQFLKAVRDVERDLYTGSNSLLKEVIDFFIDYDIKNNDKFTTDEKIDKIRNNKNEFSKKASELIEDLQRRMSSGKNEMLRYATDTGATFEKLTPSFEGKISDTELYSALKLIVETETGIKIPAVQNGLGYNNLIYISLLLAKMQKNSSGTYFGTNAKNYSILAIEEPEAHLHPSMQYKLLRFLNINRQKEVQQVFVTSHSPNITAAVDIDSLIVIDQIGYKTEVSYPGKVFSNSEEDIESKLFVERFLDVTRSDLFFAKRIIFVEGLAEQLLLPEFSSMLNKDLIDNHISVINLNGRYFNHFLKLFDSDSSKFAMKKKVACITDLDPVRKEKSTTSWKKCHPIFLNVDSQGYEYKSCSNLMIESSKSLSDNVKYFYQPVSEGSTLEYQLMLENPKCEELITLSVKNRQELIDLIKSYKKLDKTELEDFVKILKSNKINDEIKGIYKNHYLNKEDFMKHTIATRYLESLSKGVVAQELSTKIMMLNIGNEDFKNEINVPEYIKESIEWIHH
ncbi:ATP-dependent nuclease [Marinilactibacillus kalidii]|uniref:ATP-dependent nuclease n=1 Tax=Marinilactibacillus kalidii TaxID=2820274 RepID=UPI001ABE1374|nr:AAA family ATPase [Marinilactibacillus kalidii]